MVFLTVWKNRLYAASYNGIIKKWGEFYLRDFHRLPCNEKKVTLWGCAQAFHVLNIPKDVRLLLYRQILINNI